MNNTFEYIKSLCRSKNRFETLCEILDLLKIKYSVIAPGDTRNIICDFNIENSKRKYYTNVFAAHYDTVDNTPGANDNTASVAELISLAVKLQKQKITNTHDIRIIFFDKEELIRADKHKESGSFLIGKALKDNKANTNLFFVLDACGIGDTIIISNTLDYLLERKGYKRLKNNIIVLKNHLLNYLDNNGLQYLSLPTPMSDNFGLTVTGNPAVLISTLPYSEAMNYRFKKLLPETWGNMHSLEDSIDKISLVTLELMNNLLTGLCKMEIEYKFKKK